MLLVRLRVCFAANAGAHTACEWHSMPVYTVLVQPDHTVARSGPQWGPRCPGRCRSGCRRTWPCAAQSRGARSPAHGPLCDISHSSAVSATEFTRCSQMSWHHSHAWLFRHQGEPYQNRLSFGQLCWTWTHKQRDMASLAQLPAGLWRCNRAAYKCPAPLTLNPRPQTKVPEPARAPRQRRWATRWSPRRRRPPRGRSGSGVHTKPQNLHRTARKCARLGSVRGRHGGRHGGGCHRAADQVRAVVQVVDGKHGRGLQVAERHRRRRPVVAVHDVGPGAQAVTESGGGCITRARPAVGIA